MFLIRQLAIETIVQQLHLNYITVQTEISDMTRKGHQLNISSCLAGGLSQLLTLNEILQAPVFLSGPR